MIRLTWRQFQYQAAVAVALLVAVLILFATTRGNVDHLYTVFTKANALCRNNPDCPGVGIQLSRLDQLLELIGTALVVVPALIGVFWGAPLIAREFENGTHRLAWTQSVTRTRWLASKLAVVGLASVVATGLLSLLVTWWQSPIDRAHMDRFGSGLFGMRNITPMGYAAFGLVLGVVFGLLIRRTLPAMAATIFSFLAVRMTFTYVVRPNIFSPRHKTFALDPNNMGFGSTNGGPATLMPNSPNLPNAWVYSTHVVDSAGNALTPATVATTCPTLPFPSGHPAPIGTSTRIRVAAPGGVQDALHDCVTKLSATYHQVVTYQPANRYWTLQWGETVVYFAAAAAIAAFCFWWIRRGAR